MRPWSRTVIEAYLKPKWALWDRYGNDLLVHILASVPPPQSDPESLEATHSSARTMDTHSNAGSSTTRVSQRPCVDAQSGSFNSGALDFSPVF
ncbi:hypothetical protein BV22DRAFT_1042157 [Leucogyrophana mollusca]|uniref:Uncharacterized protein n=1 Tax=Leucogyrophana mollusca TaxID=85980 RepID=A0ACB8AWT9_9AGAM|nr:hypothetical protein BV22DRAFT_1042157 [Leucogyrophana mollusca]